MRLYHFLRTCHALEGVAKRRVKISLFRDVNDPWELLPFDMSEPRARRALESTKAWADSNFSAICLCKRWQSPLMWAHYAEKHQGIVLGFDVTDALATKMHYVPAVYKIAPSNTEDFGHQRLSDGRKLIEAMFTTKFDEWKYEEEYRLFPKKDETNMENGIEFYPFSEHLALREVILGEKCLLTIAQFRAQTPDLQSVVSVIRAQRAVHAFQLERAPSL